MVRPPLSWFDIAFSVYIGVALVFVMTLVIVLLQRNNNVESFCNCAGAGVARKETDTTLYQTYRDGIFTKQM